MEVRTKGAIRMERFKHTEETAKLFNKVIGDYWEIGSNKDLAKRHLSYSDYQSLGFLLDSLRFYGQTKTAIKSVADYFSKLGCAVTYRGIVYAVSL